MNRPQTRTFPVGELTVGGVNLFLIAGPCVIENESHSMKMAQAIKTAADEVGIPLIFKASFDKANRSSIRSFRGPGLEEGLRVLERVNREFKLPILTDVHEVSQVGPVREVADVLQIPAFLCRQTDLLVAVASSGAVMNVKKGQFLAPWDMQNIVEKAESAGCERLILTERGCSFGYNNLVVDMRSFPIMRSWGWPVVFDITHSLQLPGGLGDATGGQSEFIEHLARAGVACGVDGVFMEIHDDPPHALSDGPNALPLSRLKPLLGLLKRIDETIKGASV
ncbi:MAG: 3-deoxy-8-phosphooctulonate synthase [Acidobacteria bacterium]|nr:3-deoxy-8-phosphooctulonate synthase [Acidobacteriota bacterium]